ncbi:hybrid sensor histidine kinase/response regulator [Sinomicrobium weinanense]|uniref:histidine kinase n=1 Tax=Sinomicrobium weinanense TaxID=2842200 RepID=A0A926JNX4_9FLAO|nr:ATP-binding protein [Sinomicrobium weinanense]MBC9794659.1 response regulator [Sinomicrobium weinanense]MBU3124144.1 response regulator [Sinomicrobium weinanense]
MFRLKGKALWLFAIIVVGFASVGVYFYISLQSLNKQVEASVYPQRRSDYLKKTALDVNRLNNLYLVDSIKFSPEKVDSIIDAIELNLDSIKTDSYDSDILDGKKLDTIPKLLRSVQKEYLELERIKQESASKFINDLESLLRKELAELKLNSKDSVAIIRQITSKIYDRAIDENDNFTDADIRSERGKGFLRRLFGSDNKDGKNEKRDDPPAREIPKSRQDTLVSTSVDTLLTAPVFQDSSEIKIISVFERVQKRQISIQEQLNDREKQIFQKNLQVSNYIENILKELLFEEVKAFNRSIDDFSEKSKTHLWKSGIIILVFLLIGLISTFVTIKDINNSIYYQKKLEASEKRALREAEEKQKFLSTMSHELRTPLTSIIGYVDMLNQNDENVKAIKTASNYLYQMTNEILDMAKIKAGIIDIKNEAFNLNEVFEMIRDNFEPLIKNQGLKPVFKFPGTPVYVFSDQYRILQIVYNLVHNALKYTEKGSIEVRCEHQVIENGFTELNIVIEDSGIGMDEEEQTTIFKDYQQAGTHKNKMKGTGLGMGIVKKLVKEMGGQLKLKSELSRGTRFDILFTFKSAKASDVQLPEKIRELPADVLQGKRIFAVDDDPLITRLYENIFTGFGAEITTVNQAKKAKDHLLQNSYDLVIFDMKMPQMTGSEVMDALIEAGVKLQRSVICTANVLLSEEDKKNFDKFDHQLFKPLKKQDIIRLILKAFDIQDSHSSEEDSAKAPETGPGCLYSLEDLRAYTGDDEEALLEMLHLLLSENKKELEKLEQTIEASDLEECANIIHKLSSRFAQLNIEPPVDPKQTELDLRDQKDQSIQQVRTLFEFWNKCNVFLTGKYKK